MKDGKEASCATGKKRKGRSVGSSRLKSKGIERGGRQCPSCEGISEGKLAKLKKRI